MLPNHVVTGLLHESAQTSVYRGLDGALRSPVILKTPTDPAPDAAALVRLRDEYALLQSVACAGVPTPRALHALHGSLVLVHEDIGGEPLDTLSLGRPMPLAAFFPIALSLAETLECIHRQRIVHRDIKPQNIIVNRATGQVQIIDFGLASRLSREHSELAPPDRLEGTLLYLAPEQTGRMNRAVDYRADFYSLGVTFYELLTGRPPFVTRDALELVHCHLAREPRAPQELEPSVPPPLSALVLKMLAKLAEDRYQSAAGLRADLQRCAREWRTGGRIAAFALGQEDFSDRFQLPQRLYGREDEVAALLATYERVAGSGTPALVFIAGYSGIGKSALVAELHKPITAQRGYFVSAKFDQYRRGISFGTLALAFQALTQQLLAESAARLQRWRERIAEALGDSGQALVDLVPQLQLILGVQPPLPELAPEQAQHRLYRVFQRFVACLATDEHPLVLFLDDLQWADTASLGLLAHVSTHAGTRHLLVLGAYRDNEVGPVHPLMLMRADLQRQGVEPLTIKLPTLAPRHVARIVADTLHCDEHSAEPIARLVHAKTGGNPFFCGQFLSTLYQDGLLAFDDGQRRWRWNLADIESRNFTDNVVSLMLGELHRLPQATREALTCGGFLGNEFEITTLALVLERDLQRTVDDLWPALSVGLLMRFGERCRFLHDRVQEAAYLLTGEAQRARMHERIGGLLLAGTPEGSLDERVFTIVEHLNAGAEAIGEPQARHRLARLNRRAGELAHRSSAHASAAACFAAGVRMLGADLDEPALWDGEAYELSYGLLLALATSEALAGHPERAAVPLDIVLRHARSSVDRAAAHLIRARVHMTAGENPQACAVARTALRDLGLELPDHPTRGDVQRAYAEIRTLLAERHGGGDNAAAAVIDLPRISDPTARAAMRLLVAVSTASYFTDQGLWARQVMEMVRLSLRHGNDDSSVMVYAFCGFMLAGYLHEYEDGYRFAEAARSLLERSRDQPQRGDLLMHQALTGVWVRPLEPMIAMFREAVPAAIENGNRIIACLAHRMVVVTMLFRGDPLEDVDLEAARCVELARQSGYGLVVDLVTIVRRSLERLRGSAGLAHLGAAAAPAAAPAADGEPSPFVAFCQGLADLGEAVVFGDFERARRLSRDLQPLLWSAVGLLLLHDYHLLSVLALAASHDSATADASAAHEALATISTHEAALARWAGTRAEAFAPAHRLARAEAARLAGRPLEAMRLYDEAADRARAAGLVHVEALAHEAAARFYLCNAGTGTAEHHLRQTRAAYQRWGAAAKVEQLDQRFPNLRRLVPRSSSDSSGTATNVAQLDAIAVARASQAISGQIVRDRLLATLMEVVLEQGGAQFGALLLHEHDALVLAASAVVEAQAVRVRLGEEARADRGTDAGRALPSTLLAYVQRSHESVLIDDARAAHRFSADPYFRGDDAGARTVMCLPILRQGVLVAVLYLEHGALSYAFMPSQLKVLEQLGAQAAISLENAQLYAELAQHKRELEATVEARTAELETSRNVLQTILDSSPALIALKDTQGRYLLHNRSYAQKLGQRGDSLVGLTVRDLLDEGTASRSLAQDRYVLETRRTLRHEEDLPVAGGMRTFQVLKFPVQDATGRTYAVGSIAIDISELMAARTAAEAATQAKSDFLANMSHEIRTPMNAILGMAHLALKSGLNAQQHNYVQKVERSARSLLGLINDILDFSKIEAGKLEMEHLPFQLDDVLDNVVNLVGLQAESKQLELVFNLPSTLPTLLVGDALRLGQVLVNLCGNAVKFTEQGEVVVTVTQLERGAHDVVLGFAVSDSGVGLSPEQQAHLFQPFSQVDGSTSRRFGGTGLGLAVSRSLVTLMQGTIGVESALGEGSTFRFNARFGLQQTPGRAAAAVARGDRLLQAARLLLVHPNTAARERIAHMARSLGLTVEAVADGWDALRAASIAVRHERAFDLALVDWKLPGMDGIECAHQLATGAHDARPVLLMATGFSHDLVLARLEALKVHVSDILAKPVTPARLREACVAALGGRRAAVAANPLETDGGMARHAALRGARVLLVEDNQLNQELALELLEGAGLRVTVASHGAQALEALATQTFDGVLMDVQMPVMDGYEATRAIRAQPRLQRLPIIAMTANAMSGDRDRALAAGMNDYVAKPLNVGAMFDTIARWVRAGSGSALPAVQPGAPALAAAQAVPGPGGDAPGAAAAAAPGGATAVLPELPGIDIRIGRESTAGNERLYRRLLVKFRDTQHDLPARLRVALAARDRVLARRLAHDLKSMGGTLGAAGVQQAAHALEAACIGDAEDAAFAPLVDALDAALRPVLAGLESLQ